jgi:flavin reductase (DIM6/NTAB) family NADH-FMN oxidoreductase RutF
MKKVLPVLLSVIFLTSCIGKVKEAAATENINIETIDYTNVKDKSFEDLFKKIEPTELTDNVFKLVGQDYTVITAGTDSAFNSMTASWGGWGQLFEVPVTWCFLNASRYTLEFIKKEQTYTMTYFPEQFKEQVIAFGSKSGRNSDKMKETALTHVKTPSNNITYKEAKLIIECKLVEITETNPKDFYSEKGKDFVEKGMKDGNGKEYHKLVFGDITNVWVRK